MDINQKERAKKKFEELTKNANESDIKKINAKIESMNKGKLKEVWDKVMLLWQFVKDPNAPWTGKALAIGALLYVISPIDAIPDFIPLAGLLDDTSIILAAIAKLSSELQDYKKIDK